MGIKAPFLPYEQIGRISNSFLQKYHDSSELPIPIEHIIEFGLDLHIIPMENLYKIFRQNGFLSADRTSIYIDAYQYDNYVGKYRFTLAHEVGHYIMHEELYQGLNFNSVEDYMNFLESIPHNELLWFERQGDNFAGHVLVPTTLLEKKCNELIGEIDTIFSGRYPSPQDFWQYVSTELSEMFDVNPIVVEIRIKNEGIDRKLSHYFQQRR